MSSREANKEATIRQYYTELNKHIQNEEFDKAVKSANKSNKKMSANFSLKSTFT